MSTSHGVNVKVTCKQGACSFAEEEALREHALDLSKMVVAKLPCGTFARFICPGCGSLEDQLLDEDQVVLFAPVRHLVSWIVAPQEAYETYATMGAVISYDDILDFNAALGDLGDSALLGADDPRVAVSV